MGVRNFTLRVTENQDPVAQSNYPKGHASVWSHSFELSKKTYSVKQNA